MELQQLLQMQYADNIRNTGDSGSAISLAATTVIARCVGAGDEKQVRFYNRLLLKNQIMFLIVFCGAFWFGLPAILPLYHLSGQTAVLATKMIFSSYTWSNCYLAADFRAAFFHAGGRGREVCYGNRLSQCLFSDWELHICFATTL